jgi:hypothetical protein
MKKDFQVSQIDAMVKTVKRFTRRMGYDGEVSRDNLEFIVKSLAESYPEAFAKELEYGYEFAVKQYGFYTSNETKHFEENYHLITDNLDNILSILDIDTDYPGLYPTYTLNRNGKTLSEYSPLNALRQYNNFWGHW